MPDDVLTVALEEIRGRGYRNGATGAECARLSDAADKDIPRLLGAVEAVLKQHHPVFTDYADGDGIERSSYECAECGAPGTPDNWPCPTVEAITTALTDPLGQQQGAGDGL